MSRWNPLSSKTWVCQKFCNNPRRLAATAAGRFFVKLFLPLCIWGGVQIQASSEGFGDVGKGWREAAIFQFQEAHQTFLSKASTGQEERERRLGTAITKLAIQPRTHWNIKEATNELKQLVDENRDDEIGRAARFYLARIYEVHTAPPDKSQARQLFYDLALEPECDIFKELAATRVLSIDLEEAASQGRNLSEVLKKLDLLAANLQTDLGKREYHTTAGLMLTALSDEPEAALRELEIAAAIPGGLSRVRASVLLSAAAHAERLGQNQTARNFYSQFVEEFPRDFRRYAVEKILESLPEEDGAPGLLSSPHSQQAPANHDYAK